MASTGGPVSGHDESDKAGWQSNTKKLEAAGAMGIEYSLSCPQGGDGTEGDIVSQNAALTAKIIDWVMEVGDPDIPKLFKLTAAVTSIVPILRAIKQVFAKYPNKKAGVTLANSFPTLAFRRKSNDRVWEEGVIVGMSGEGVTPISNLTLSQAVPEGIAISGNGGPMNYKAAVDFLALGVKTVQFCTLPTKYGYGVIQEIEFGTSYLMQERGIKSTREINWNRSTSSGHRLHGAYADQKTFGLQLRLMRLMRKLCTLSIPGDQPRRKAASVLRSGALHRLYALRAEMSGRRYHDA